MTTQTEVRLPPRTTYSLRLRIPERRLVETAALARQMTLAEYIRDAITRAAREDLGR
jgi:uncharacterized protein (DUF1778 family)